MNKEDIIQLLYEINKKCEILKSQIDSIKEFTRVMISNIKD